MIKMLRHTRIPLSLAHNYTHFSIALVCCIFTMQLSFGQTSNWVGGINTDYFTVTNWSNTTIKFSTIASTTLNIGVGKPNYCYLAGGSSATAYRPAKLNTLSGSTFSVAGTVYPSSNDTLNGAIDFLSGADFNVRNNINGGRNGALVVNMLGGKFTSRFVMNLAMGDSGSSALVTANGGSINTGTDLALANGTGLTGSIVLNGASLNIGRNLLIGTGGNIYIEGISFLKITGNKVAQLTALVTSGQLTCPAGNQLSITFDGTNTLAQLPIKANSMIREYPDSVVLNSGKVICVIDKNSGNVLSYRFGRQETVANKSTDTHKYMYHDFTTSVGFETMWGCTLEVIQDSTDFAHIVIKRPYTPAIGHATPCDAELHYAIKKNDMAVYVYSKLEHKPNYPKFDLGSWRQVWWIASTNGVNLCERIYTDSLRSWQMPSGYDYGKGVGSGGPQEIIKLTTGVRAGKFDGKYEYSLRFWEHPLWGHASNINKIGSWCVNPSCEYYNEGPMYHDLNAAAGIIHQCMNGVHYGVGGMAADTLTSWKKVYGPYLLLLTNQATGDDNWAAAKQRLADEKNQWPYSWVKDTVAYPLAQQRGAVTGKFVITDALNPSFTGAGAWVGVTNLADGANGFQFECKDYQYWVKSDSAGNFTIPNIRPGTYSFFAFVDGAVGEFRLNNVKVTAGATKNIGTLTRNIERTYGKMIWEIATPNRMANEFKMGDFDYCEGNVQFKFRDSFPNPIEYNIADNNFGAILPYAHTKYPDTAAIPAPGDLWKWRLRFTLPSGFLKTGNARLTIAYASNDHAQQSIYVNNENTIFTSYYPDFGDGNAFLRQTNYATYAYKQVLIPMNKFVVGTNTITLGMPSNSGWVSHLMYDYLSLEANLGILPVQLLSFTATATNKNNVVLYWATASETNNGKFEVERSSDGLLFTAIANVKAVGNSVTQNNYSFTDALPQQGNNYYRLKQVDVNGAYTYSEIKLVRIGDTPIPSVSVYPNPANSFLAVKSNTNNTLKQVYVYNAVGSLLYANANVNTNNWKLDISAYSTGIYIVKIKDGVQVFTQKVVKQ